MAQTFDTKQLNLASDAATRARALLTAAAALDQDSATLAQAGANFADPIFDGSSLSYLSAYQANVFFQTIVPALAVWLDTPVSGVPGSITYRGWFETMIPGA